jgi:hypothetical protein
MATRIESLRRKAEDLFLGQYPVLGIGIAGHTPRRELVFLLSGESKKTMDLIRKWARKTRVPIRFVVTGAINALSKVQ